MIPVQLTLRGINSYQKEFIIDFNKLVAGQLFGIFGPVGSGKSTILEAISLALYGETERLNAQDRRSYNLMNLQSNELFVDFIFQMDTDELQYRFTIRAKRNSKQFEKVNTFERNAYQKIDGDWVPINKTAEEILGLSYPNFRRTVIIPQGKFQEFLQLKASERTKMLKEIFGLERFDLQYKVQSLEKKNDLEVEKIKGGLQQYEQIDQNVLNAKKVALEEAEKIETALLKKEMNYEKLNQSIQSFFAAKEDLTKALNRHQAILKEQAEKENRLIQQKKDFESSKVAYEGLDKLKQKVDEIEDLQTIKSKMNEIEEKQKSIEKGKIFLKKWQSELNELEKQINDIAREKNNYKANLPKEDLNVIKAWFVEKNQKEKNITSLEEDIASVSKDIEKAGEQIFMDMQAQIYGQSALISATADLSPLMNHYQQQKDQVEEQLKQLSSEAQSLKVVLELDKYARELEEDKPCPLCGALHHPKIHEAQAAETDLEAVNTKITTREQQLKSITENIRKIDAKAAEIKEKQNRLNQLTERKKAQLNTLKNYIENTFNWDGFDKNSEAKLDESIKKEKQDREAIQKLDQHLDQSREKKDEFIKLLQDGEKKVTRYENDCATLSGVIQTLKQKLKLLKWEAYQARQIKDLDNEIRETNQSINQIEETYLKGKSIIEETEREYHKLSGEEKRQLELVKNSEINFEKEKTALLSFEAQNLDEICKALLTHIEKTGAPQEMAVQEFHQTLLRLKEELKFHSQNKQKLYADFERIQQSLAIKLKLQKNLKVLEDRAENLRTLRNLFKGSGFVDYISSIYLQELCAAANKRFYKLTRQQLQLSITDKNNFEIIDFLNQGKRRSAKTLSGGQTFQAALSLALALAESIRSQAKASQNFFFMDEGFGSQDKESLELVLGTLKSLRKENRVVGIISHVEALKQEIAVFLSIENKEGEGSRIENSWD